MAFENMYMYFIQGGATEQCESINGCLNTAHLSNDAKNWENVLRWL